MATTINADNGAVSGSAGLKESADSSGVLALQTNGTTAVSISTGQVVTLTNALPAGSGGTGLTGFTANGVVYASSASALTTGASITFDGTNLAVAGSVSGSSDETLKTNWRELPTDFIDRLAKVKHGVYDRVDIEATQVGVSAQSLRSVMEHAVIEDANGILSVTYGNAALVAVIKLAERVLELEARLKVLESK